MEAALQAPKTYLCLYSVDEARRKSENFKNSRIL